MEWLVVILQGAWKGLLGLQKPALIVIPVFILLEWLKVSGWLDRFTRAVRPLTRPLGLPGEAALPLSAAILIGLTFGSGIVLQAGREGNLNRNELTVTCVFAGICHAMIEEPLLFATAGPSPLILAGVRFVLAVFFAAIAAAVLKGRTARREITRAV